MQVFRRISAQAFRPAAVTIGNFDGVHLGHKTLLASLKQKASELGLASAVVCFEPHPREFFAPESAPPRLTSIRRKLELLEDAGIDQVFIQRFDTSFASLSAEAFVDKVLVRGLHTRHLIIGDDFRFGRNRIGDFDLLRQAGLHHGFSVQAMHTLTVESERVSSSAVREALQAGEIEHATRLLGEPYVLEGRVMHGEKIGRTIGYPTANIRLTQPSLPISGIFAVTVDGGPLQQAIGAANVGVRPTIGDRLALRLEVFVLDFSGDLYRQRLRVRFWHKVRSEAKYPSLDALKAAIDDDCQQVKQFFRERGIP